MGIAEARQKCPDLMLVSGEDLGPYRAASRAILDVLRRFGVAERGGMDEVLVDVTAEAQARIARGAAETRWRAHPTAAEAQAQPTSWQPLLMTGTAIAQEARAAIRAETGFRTSAGVACNRLLAKLVSGLHKPDDQTVLCP
eukprot:jgi/Astpho2/8712/gw1.00128.65.1_t